jgi:hypothetical protein
MPTEDDAYEAFNRERGKLIAGINEQNAQTKLDEAKAEIINGLKNLDVDKLKDLSELNKFFLSVAKFNQAAAILSGNDFEAVIPSFVEEFQDYQNELQKIAQIEEKFTFEVIINEAPWAGLYRVLESVKEQLAAESTNKRVLSVLNDTVPKYRDHLQKKLLNSGGIPDRHEAIPEDVSLTRKKLVTRYRAIQDLENLIQNKASLTPDDVTSAKQHVQTCCDNKPDWFERDFLKKFTDVLSLGLKPIYRAFFSKEKALDKTLDNTLDELFKPPNRNN